MVASATVRAKAGDMAREKGSGEGRIGIYKPDRFFLAKFFLVTHVKLVHDFYVYRGLLKLVVSYNSLDSFFGYVFTKAIITQASYKIILSLSFSDVDIISWWI